MKLKYIVKLSLVCGVMSTAVALSGCGSSKAVQANAAAVSTDNESASAVVSSSSGVPVSSDLVSHSTSLVSSSVVSSVAGKTASINSTSHQASSTKSTSGVTKSTTKPVSTATKPASTKPASTAPAPKPVSTAPSTGSISAKYNGATYGATSQSQYNEILSVAKAVTSRSDYKASYAENQKNPGVFEDFYGFPYSDEANKVSSIIGCFPHTSSSGSHGNAYIAMTSGQSSVNCADSAKATQAALNVNGISCKLVWGKNARGQAHMWTEFTVNGTTYQWGNTFSKGTPSGYTVYGSGYNY